LLLIRETDELEIKSKNRFIQISLDQSPVDIIVTNIDGNILYANPQYKKSVGLEDKDILNKKAQIFTSNINQTENTDEILHEMNQGKSWQGEIDVLDANGHLNTKKVVLAPLIIGVNEDKNVIMYQIDITQSKINQALIQKQNEQLNSHIKAKDKFISVLAHDLRSPIAGFYQLTTLMYKNFKNYEPDALRNMLELLNRNAYNNFQLLDNLLQWAKSFQKNIMFNRKPINLKIFIDDSILNLQEYSNLKNILILNNVTENIEILGHPEMLKTILRNLIINATKYTPNNGSINISAREDEQYTYISVSDTGIGMSEHVRENLFKLEETKTLQGTNGEQGTGFGLVICNDFVLKHQGKIWVESEPNKGSTFSFSFSRT